MQSVLLSDQSVVGGFVGRMYLGPSRTSSRRLSGPKQWTVCFGGSRVATGATE